jgi:hypothetical protein
MNYPNGATLRYRDGSLNNANGNTNHTGSVSLSAPFGDTTMRVIAKPASLEIETTIAYGNGILILTLDGNGTVSCAVEGGNGPSEFKIEGALGSAYVTVKQGEDARALKLLSKKSWMADKNIFLLCPQRNLGGSLTT